jgi:cold shock CspA family protein
MNSAKVIHAAESFRRPESKPSEATCSGKVRFFKANEGYGFIAGDNGEDYYFNQYSVKNYTGKIVCGQQVTFVPETGAKGPKASSIILQDLLYEKPKAFLFSENEEIRHWDILESLGQYREQEAKTISEAKFKLRNIAVAYGGNAIINLLISKDLESKGNYYHSTYTARGIPVQIARKTSDGRYEIDDFRSMKNILSKVNKYRTEKGEMDEDVKAVIMAEGIDTSGGGGKGVQVMLFFLFLFLFFIIIANIK